MLGLRGPFDRTFGERLSDHLASFGGSWAFLIAFGAMLVDAKRGEMVVDFCAGAGGKTLAIGAAMPGSAT